MPKALVAYYSVTGNTERMAVRIAKALSGGAFCSSGNRAGGNETAVLDILGSLMIHGMIVQGDHQGDHYGPAAVGRPEEKDLRTCDKYGRKLAALTLKLRG